MRMTTPANPVERQEDKEEIQTKPLASSITPLIQRFTSFITSPLQRQAENEEEIQTNACLHLAVSKRAVPSRAASPTCVRAGDPCRVDCADRWWQAFDADFSGMRSRTLAASPSN